MIIWNYIKVCNEKINPILNVKASTSKKEFERWLESVTLLLKICEEFGKNITSFIQSEERKSIKMVI